MIRRGIYSVVRHFKTNVIGLNLFGRIACISNVKQESNINSKEQQILHEQNANHNLNSIYDQTSFKQQCWNCNSHNFQANLFMCGSCKHLQDPSKSIMFMNYFKLFEIGLSYEINQLELTQRYKDLQRNFHPDKFSSLKNSVKHNSFKIMKFSEIYSTYINEAYSTLKDDLERSEYLIDLLTNGKKEDMEKKVQESDNFLSEIMEMRMDIEECECDEELQVIEQKLDLIQQSINVLIDTHLQNQNYQNAVESLIKMRYNKSSLNAIKLKSENLAFNK